METTSIHSERFVDERNVRMIVKVANKTAARVPEQTLKDRHGACFSNILCTERICSCTTARNCLGVGSYSPDGNARGCKLDRASFSHADVVQSTVLEDHQYCVTKSGR